MANLVETPLWEDGVYQIETSDPVLGGPEGISNRQAKQLANRTMYLKALAESLGVDKQPVDATLTALAALATAANQIIYSTGADTFALASLTPFARTLLDDVDAATALGTLGAAPLASPNFAGTPRAPTAALGTNTDQLANTAFVQAAIAALVASSPAALDTLNELAAALGNDANFATTMANALALKAPLASPALTGSPTAPTPAQFDNSTKLANMEAVQRALGNFRGVVTLNANTVLTAADAGKLFVPFGTSAITITLPLANTCPSGGTLYFENVANQPVTITRQGANMIQAGATAGLTSIVLAPGETLTLTTETNGWYAPGGSATLPYETKFAASLSGNGYRKLPSGDIEQWGTVVANASANTAVTLPIAFTSAIYGVTITQVLSSGTGGVGVNSLGLTTFNVWNGFGGALTVYWRAIGK